MSSACWEPPPASGRMSPAEAGTAVIRSASRAAGRARASSVVGRDAVHRGAQCIDWPGGIAQSPVNLAPRFSRKALTPSTKSAEAAICSCRDASSSSCSSSPAYTRALSCSLAAA